MAYLTPYSFYQLCREYEVEMDSKNFYSLFLKYIIIGKTKSAKKIKYELPFLAIRNKQKRTLFN